MRVFIVSCGGRKQNDDQIIKTLTRVRCWLDPRCLAVVASHPFTGVIIKCAVEFYEGQFKIIYKSLHHSLSFYSKNCPSIIPSNMRKDKIRCLKFYIAYNSMRQRKCNGYLLPFCTYHSERNPERCCHTCSCQTGTQSPLFPLHNSVLSPHTGCDTGAGRVHHL